MLIHPLLVAFHKICSLEKKRIEEIRILESVDWAYMESFFEGIKTKYGSIETFLSQRIGIDEDKLKKLKEKYTEKI